MKNSKCPSATRLVGQFIVPVSLLVLVILQIWSFADETLNPGEEVIVAYNGQAGNSERDMVSLLLARQLGLTNVAPLPPEEAKRQYWASQIELNKITDRQSRHNYDLHEHFLGWQHIIKIVLLLVAVIAASMETYIKIKSACRPSTAVEAEADGTAG